MSTLDELTPDARRVRAACIVAVVGEAVDCEHGVNLAHEYVREAEHQDGYGYWHDSFGSDPVIACGLAVADFRLYLENK